MTTPLLECQSDFCFETDQQWFMVEHTLKTLLWTNRKFLLNGFLHVLSC